MLRSRIIKRSGLCFYFGLVGLIPLLGAPLAIVTLVLSRSVTQALPGVWNPADAYRFWGVVFAWLGLAMGCLALFAAGLVIWQIWP